MTDRKQALRALIEAVGKGDRALVLDHSDAVPSRQWQDLMDAMGGSLDAALRLHEALLPGWVWWFEPFREVSFAGVYNPAVSPRPVTGDSKIPARAWLLAILKALEAQE